MSYLQNVRHNQQIICFKYSSANDTSKLVSDLNNTYYIGILGAFGFGAAVMSFIRNLAFFVACANASVRVHSGLFNVVIRGAMRFFDTTPTGSVVNR